MVSTSPQPLLASSLIRHSTTTAPRLNQPIVPGPDRKTRIFPLPYSGILQADAFDGYSKLYATARQPKPVKEAACWVHARRPFFAMADLEQSARLKAAGKQDI